MKDSRIEQFEKTQMKENPADVHVGDTVIVHKVIVEGKKKRTQRFQGTVIKKQGSLSRASFTVRKIVEGIGVEKLFLLHSPLVPKIEIVKRSKVRRAKLYYLRKRIGARANRLKVKEMQEEKQEKIQGTQNVSQEATQAQKPELKTKVVESKSKEDKKTIKATEKTKKSENKEKKDTQNAGKTKDTDTKKDTDSAE